MFRNVTIRTKGITLRTLAVLSLAAATLISGCSSQKACTYRYDNAIFFPPAPDEPHIQYLTGINSSDDLGGKKKQSGFSLFLTGKEGPDILKKIGKSYGIVEYKGKLYVAEGMNGRIDIIDPVRGTFENPVGHRNPKGMLKYPVNLTLDDEGYLYVADTARRDIVVYNPAGEYFATFPNSVYDPKSKIVDVKYYDGKLFALDMPVGRIRVLDRKTGAQLQEMGYIEKPDQSVRLPGNLAIDGTGNLYVSNIGSNRVTKYDQDGHYLGSFGGAGDTVGSFAKPKGVAVSEGWIFVVDGGTNVVQLFDDKFRPLTYFGWPGLPWGSLNGPAGITVSKDPGQVAYFQNFAAPGFKVSSLVFVVSQFGQENCIPRVSVYGIGEMQKK